MTKSRISQIIVTLSALMLLFTTVSATFASSAKTAPNPLAVPVMQFLAPSVGQEVSGVQNVSVYVPPSRDRNVPSPRYLALYVDGNYAGNMTHTNNGVYIATWNTLRYRDGRHSLTASTFGSGAVGSRAQVTVTVRNGNYP